MPTTPTYGFPYPALTDPPNVPANMQSLATSVETAVANNSIPVVTSTSSITNPYTGQLVISTSDLLIYRYNGTAWVKRDSDIPACTVVINSTFSVPNNVDTDVVWTGADENWTNPISGLAMWSSPASQMTIRKDGYYIVGFNFTYAWVSGFKRATTLTKNNSGIPTTASALAYDAQIVPGTSVPTVMAASNGVRLVSGDILRVNTYQNTGAALNIIGNGIEGVARMWAVWQKP